MSIKPTEYNSTKGQDILNALRELNEPIRASDLVKLLKIKHSTLNSVLIRLQEEGFILWEKYGLIELTEKGRMYASHFTNHHLIIERFLVETLRITGEKAHEDAIAISRVISCDLINAICNKLGISHDKVSPEYCALRNSLLN